MKSVGMVMLSLALGACAGHDVNCAAALQPINTPAIKSPPLRAAPRPAAEPSR